MTPLKLNGVTLGQKHEHYNALVKTASSDETFTLESINYDDKDMDNLFKIDVSCARQNAQYLLEVLKGGDMLYVSRALRSSTWLVCDDQYAHIINPYYLHQQLFPEMKNKAKNKLLLTIRLYLRNEKRVDEFYSFFNFEDFKTAQKWLPHCSESLIISVIKNDRVNIDLNIMKRLCRKSLAILKICCEINPSECWLKSAITFLFTDTERYLEIINSVDEIFIPKFGKKATRFLMNRCPRIICNNFYKYCYKIDLPEFGKHLKPKEIQPFLTKQLLSDRDSIRSWCKYKYVKHIIKRVPAEQRFQLVQELFLNGANTTSPNNTKSEETEETIEDSYSWYRFAPFETAFNAIKDKIFDEACTVESSVGVMNLLGCPFTFPSTVIRPWTLKVLVRCARGNLQHLQTLISSYHGQAEDKDIFDECISSYLLQITKIHKYDEITWKMLNDIFKNMGIYSDVNKNNRADIKIRYIPTIVLYTVLNDQCIPTVIEDNIALDNFKKIRNKLDPDESQKIFKCLYRYASKQLINSKVRNKNDFAAVISMCDEMIRFMKDWKKNVAEFSFLLDKIRELIKIKNENSWGKDVSKMLIDLYRQHKSIRRLLFEDSLTLCPSDETCLNILKHNPDLLLRHKTSTETIIPKNKMSLRRTLRKLRVYYPNSIAKQWVDCFFIRLRQPSDLKSCIEGLFILLPCKEALKLVKTYTPKVININRKEETSTISFDIKKNIAKCLYLLRPAVSLDTILLYTKGVYFRFAAPLLYLTLLDTRSDEALPYINKFLTESGSYQKLGILYMLKKFDVNKTKQSILNVWNLTTRYSVRCGLFKYTYKLLVKEKESRMIIKIWELLDEIMCNLTDEFYATIKVKMGNINKIPKIVKYKLFRRIILYLKTHVPDSLEINYFISDFWTDLRLEVRIVEVSFIDMLLLEAIDKCFIEDSNNEYYYFRKDILRVLTTYLTTNNSVKIQQMKFDKLFVPAMERFLVVWQDHKNLFKKVLESLSLNISKRLLFEKNFKVPVHLYKNIQTIIRDSFSIEKEYNIITFWNITVLFVELLETFSTGDVFQSIVDNVRSQDQYRTYQYEYPEFENVCSNIAPAFGKACVNYLKQDLISTYPSLWPVTSKSMMDALISLSFPYSVIYQTLKYMLLDEDAVEVTAHYQVAVGVIRFMYINSGNGEYKFSFDEELDNIIMAHPSNVIRTYYSHSYFPFCEVYQEDENSNWRRTGLMPEGGPKDHYVY
ncbi:unnamed protein product [Chilo suppressalis]|uniref:RZZ complex subunit KNTC1/ROD C-terminal domain-containing protein n=1 Tax=Chilo suppressalis TaxID=168631 RepID=A0ABN8L975_CHISP|nr:unnamed protein product [Chilo suppressalis]